MLLIAPLGALVACSSVETASRADVMALRGELRTLRDTNARLEQRLERIETQQAISSARSAPQASQTASPEIPELTVVKLKPRVDAAPKLDTRIPIVEPSLEDFTSLSSSPTTVSVVGEDSVEPVAMDPVLTDGEFQVGLEAIRTGNVEGGISKLEKFAQEYPRHAKADDALYFAGLGHIGLSEYSAAAKTFERLLANYPAGDTVMDALLKLAECRVRLNQKKDARTLYSQVITHYPGTAAATQAEARLASLMP